MTVRQLAVWLDAYDHPVGVLGDDAVGLPSFRYDEAYLSRRDAMPLSLALPLGNEPFDAYQSRAFFENLLQENDYLSRKLADAKIDRKDLVGVLTLMGKDCAGAVACVPLDEPKPKHPGNLDRDYTPIENLDATVVALARRRPAAPGKQLPSPIAGVQPKMALAVIDGAYCLPQNGAPSTHVLKVAPDDAPLLAENEFCCLDLARRLGVSTVQTKLVTIADRSCLLVSRYDRVQKGRQVYRLHQEDFAQALGLPASDKYEGGMTEHQPSQRGYDQTAIWTLLDKLQQPAEDKRTFLKLTLVNLLLANSDNHAKNHSLIYRQGRYPDLAPAYDLVATPIDVNNRLEFAFRVGAATRFDTLTTEDLITFVMPVAGTRPRARRLCVSLLSELQMLGVTDAIEEASSTASTGLRADLRALWRERWMRLEAHLLALV